MLPEKLFLALVMSHCGGFTATHKTQDSVIECMTRIVNCSIIGDGSFIDEKQVRLCLKKIPGNSGK